MIEQSLNLVCLVSKADPKNVFCEENVAAAILESASCEECANTAGYISAWILFQRQPKR